MSDKITQNAGQNNPECRSTRTETFAQRALVEQPCSTSARWAFDLKFVSWSYCFRIWCAQRALDERSTSAHWANHISVREYPSDSRPTTVSSRRTSDGKSIEFVRWASSSDIWAIFMTWTTVGHNGHGATTHVTGGTGVKNANARNFIFSYYLQRSS